MLYYTTILHPVRKQFDLSTNEYCVADLIQKLSHNPQSPHPGWCNASRQYMADELGLSRQSVITILKTLENALLVIRGANDHVQTTALWYHAVTGCKETLQGVKNLNRLTAETACTETLHPVKKLDTLPENNEPEPLEPVKKLDTPCKETVQLPVKKLDTPCKETVQLPVKKLDTIIVVNNSNDNSIDKSNKKETDPAVADAPVFEEVVIFPLNEKGSLKGKQSPKMPGEQKKAPGRSAPGFAPPPSILTQIRQFVEGQFDGYYWQAKDAVAAKDIANKLKHAITQKSGVDTVTDEKIIEALQVLVHRTAELPTYYQFTDLPALNGKFNEILTQLRVNSSQRKQTNGYSKQVAPAHRSQEQQLDEMAQLFGAIEDYVGAKQRGGATG